jgi:hypothetical protein
MICTAMLPKALSEIGLKEEVFQYKEASRMRVEGSVQSATCRAGRECLGSAQDFGAGHGRGCDRLNLAMKERLGRKDTQS